jgi:hypothetical protein
MPLLGCPHLLRDTFGFSCPYRLAVQ